MAKNGQVRTAAVGQRTKQRTLYDVLQVSRSADDLVIQAAFRGPALRGGARLGPGRRARTRLAALGAAATRHRHRRGGWGLGVRSPGSKNPRNIALPAPRNSVDSNS